MDSCPLASFCNLYSNKYLLQKKIIMPIEIFGEIPYCDRIWPVFLDGNHVGQVTSATFSPDFCKNVAIGMLDKICAKVTKSLEVETQIGVRRAVVRSKFWI